MGDVCNDDIDVDDDEVDYNVSIEFTVETSDFNKNAKANQSETRDNYIPINDMPFELSVFLPADPESRINELMFSESISLSFKTRLGLLSNSTGNTPVYF